ncbi:MAG: putative murein peptide carboxypeptidase [Fimbriimonadaceae bacterium]|nr:putative murein peptide carboxypeptidase [Fimbriimonadaceae bacterium]
MPGSHVRIVSPASPIEPIKVEAGVELLERAGYRVSLGPHVFERDYYLAGNDASRAADLMEAFLDEDVDAVWCSRGGYGCERLFPYLDLDAMAATKKPFLGFSDVTILHTALTRRGLATYHAPMAISFSVERDKWVGESLIAALQGRHEPHPDSPPGDKVIGGRAVGRLAGGCLCLMTDSLGTQNAFDGSDCIVLIEDVDEHPHRVDAMLTHLLNARVIQDASGIVVGEMTRSDEREDTTIGSKPWREIVMERLAPLGKPMIIGYPFGHQARMLSLALGLRYELDADAGRLHFCG